MSDTYFSVAGCQSSRFYSNSGVPAIREEKEGWCPREKIPWSPTLQNALLAFFVKVSYPYRCVIEIPFPDPLRSEIRRFFLSLDAYIDSPHPVIPEKDILYGVTYKDYPETLKRIKRKSFETTWRVKNFEYPDWWHDVPSYRIFDIGDIFNYSYCIFWEGETDDYLNGLIPVNIKKGILSKLKEITLSILPDRNSFSKIEDIEVLSQISSSMSIEGSNMKHIPHFKIKSKNLKFSKIRGSSERSVIQVSPNNFRDSILNYPSDLNTISLIDKQMMEILRVMPGHIHLTDKDEVTRRLKRLHKKYLFFIQRDLKKEGITKPRVILKILLEALNEKYPDIKIFRNTSFYDNFALRVNGELIYPERGHGLGMANALTTLMQLSIHNLIIDELINDTPDIDGECLCINDDFTAAFENEDFAEAYWDMEDEIMSDLSLLREPNKSFLSYMSFVLAERYFTNAGEYEKISYQLRELLLPLACYNVTHAKQYFISAQTYVSSKLVPFYMEEIKSYWGYEFYPNEFACPYILGGWINEKISSVDLSLLTLESLEPKSYHQRGFKAQLVTHKRKNSGEIFNSPIMSLLGYPNIEKQYYDHFDYLPNSAIIEKYGRLLSHSRRYFYNFWNSLYKRRQKEFKKPFEVTFEEFILMILENHKTTQFYPCDMMIKSYHRAKVIQGSISDPYIDPNAKMAYISQHNETMYPFKESFSISFTNTDAFSKKVSGLYSKEIQRSLKTELLTVLSTGRYQEVYYPADDFRPEEVYINPVKIGEVASILDWGKGYPEVHERFRDTLVAEKRKVYNYLFSVDELIEITRRSIPRLTLKRIIDHCQKNNFPFIETLHYLDESLRNEQQNMILEDSEYERFPDPLHMENEDFWKKKYPNPDKCISMSDLLLDEGCIFHSWRHSPKEYILENDQVAYYLNKMSELLIYATYPGIRSPEEKLLELQQVESSDDPILCIITSHLGIDKLLRGDECEEGLDSDEDLGALFEGE